jgi:uncharacterized protein
MKKKLEHKNLIVKESPIHGYGVFAGEDIDVGEIIEECHVLFFKKSPPEIANHIFGWDGKRFSLPLGNGAIYNHAEHNNAAAKYDKNNNLITFTAKRFIKEGEEIFSSYGNEWFSSRFLHAKKDGEAEEEEQVSLVERLSNPALKFYWRLGIICFIGLAVYLVLTHLA